MPVAVPRLSYAFNPDPADQRTIDTVQAIVDQPAFQAKVIELLAYFSREELSKGGISGPVDVLHGFFEVHDTDGDTYNLASSLFLVGEALQKMALVVPENIRNQAQELSRQILSAVEPMKNELALEILHRGEIAGLIEPIAYDDWHMETGERDLAIRVAKALDIHNAMLQQLSAPFAEAHPKIDTLNYDLEKAAKTKGGMAKVEGAHPREIIDLVGMARLLYNQVSMQQKQEMQPFFVDIQQIIDEVEKSDYAEGARDWCNVIRKQLPPKNREQGI